MWLTKYYIRTVSYASVFVFTHSLTHSADLESASTFFAVVSISLGAKHWSNFSFNIPRSCRRIFTIDYFRQTFFLSVLAIVCQPLSWAIFSSISRGLAGKSFLLIIFASLFFFSSSHRRPAIIIFRRRAGENASWQFIITVLPQPRPHFSVNILLQTVGYFLSFFSLS